MKNLLLCLTTFLVMCGFSSHLYAAACVAENNPAMAAPTDRFESDYTDHRRVLADLAEAYPDTLIWGSDSPAYSYICRRKQAEGHWLDFRLKGTYEDEVAALEALPAPLRQQVGSVNALSFIFGTELD